MNKRVTAQQAIAAIPDGATVAINPMPAEELYTTFENEFLVQGHPRDLTLVYTAGLGPFSEERRGINHFAHPGLIRRLIAGHVGLNHCIVKMIATNQFEAYNLPQGVLSQLYRDIAAKRPGHLTRIGLGTFVDPRLEGGKLNEKAAAAEDLVRVVELDGREYLFYKTFPLDVGLLRGTAADPDGNITCEDEAILMEMFELAMAVKNCGGFNIVQVDHFLDEPAHPQRVRIPGIFVDYVVKASSRKMHPHTLFVEHNPAFTGEVRISLEGELEPLPLGLEKIICRRAALELCPGHIVNLGIGIPSGVASVACEEGLLDCLQLNTELGVFGGLPERGLNFGPAKNPAAFVSQAQMFDFYGGGGLDVSCIGLAQADKSGNVNVSKLGPKIIGSGGFIDITQSAKKCLFCGEFIAGGYDAAVEDGRLIIRTEGKAAKFVEQVQQITFSGLTARTSGQQILYITERCVFQLVPEGVLLKEIAPGVDLHRDILGQMKFAPIVPAEVPLMDARIFRSEPMGLRA